MLHHSLSRRVCFLAIKNTVRFMNRLSIAAAANIQ